MRRLLALLLSLPLMASGVISAHWLAYQLAVPGATARDTLLAATGHASETWRIGVVASLAAIALVAVAGLVAGRGSLLARIRLRTRAFVALPVAAFVVQEHLERFLAGYGSPLHVWQEPTFWRGVLLQVPFGLVAYLVATLLLRGARVVRRVVERYRREHTPIISSSGWVAAVSSILVVAPRRVRGGDALRFRGPPVGLRVCL